MKTKVELAEKNRQMRRTREVDGWLQSVQVLEKQVDEILQKGNQENPEEMPWKLLSQELSVQL